MLGVARFSLPGGAPLGLGTQALRTEMEWKEVCVGEADPGATVLPPKASTPLKHRRAAVHTLTTCLSSHPWARVPYTYTPCCKGKARLGAGLTLAMPTNTAVYYPGSVVPVSLALETLPGSNPSPPMYVLTVGTRASDLTSLSLGFHICEMGMITQHICLLP